ncbi:MAG: ribosome-associated translation inhibitor RaiA [Chlamydiales bacterium]|nr:ribosome-associated translation inhibitor RaiA [Chlamydiales bacterium]
MTLDYNLYIVSKHIEVTEGMRQHILDKLSKLDKLTDAILDVHVRLEVEKKIHHNVSLTIMYAHTKIRSHASTTDLYASIDKAIDRLKIKLGHWKSKLQQHHAKGFSVEEIPVSVHQGFDLEDVNDQIDEESRKKTDQRFALPKIAKMKKLAIKTLTLEEAMMKMELSDDNFMIYRSEEDHKLKVIYRRRDATYGVIAPE